MNVQLKQVVTPKELSIFIRFPHTLFKGNTCWVPPLTMDELSTLRKDKNPAFEFCDARYWLAYDPQGRVVGRIAGIINRRHVEKWNQPYVRFGWFDFIDDPSVSAALLKAVEDWAVQNGMTAVHGPLGFTDLDREGMLIEGFDELGTMASYYNHPYYPRHIEKLGYSKDIDWVEYEISAPSEPNETIAKAAGIILKRNKLTVSFPRNKKELVAHAKEIFQLIDDEYQHLYGVVPLTPRQVESYIDQYLGFMEPAFIPMVFDENQRMVAFGITLPSLSRGLQKSRGELFPFGFIHLLNALRQKDRMDLYLIAVKSEYQGRGVNAVLMNALSQVIIQRGFKKIETNPELETNQAVQTQWKYFDRRLHKRRRCYIKTVAAG